MAVSRPYRPTPWREDMNFYFWNQWGEMAAPDHPCFTYTKAADAGNGRSSPDLDHDIAWGNGKIRGYVAEIKESKSENTKTPVALTIITRIWVVEDFFGPAMSDSSPLLSLNSGEALGGHTHRRA